MSQRQGELAVCAWADIGRRIEFLGLVMTVKSAAHLYGCRDMSIPM